MKYYKAEDVINAIENKIAEYIPTLFGRYEEIPLELRMAIEHLPTIEVSEEKVKTSQETLTISDDAISRTEFIEMIKGMITDATSHGISPRLDPHFVISMVKSAPSVIPEPKEGEWIPCSERMPEDSGDYLVCPSDSVLEDYSDFSEVMIMPYDADCEAFGWWTERYDPISLGYVDSDFNEFEVVSWMPLPTLWKGENQ